MAICSSFVVPLSGQDAGVGNEPWTTDALQREDPTYWKFMEGGRKGGRDGPGFVWSEVAETKEHMEQTTMTVTIDYATTTT